MSDPSTGPVTGVVVAHGQMARGLVDAVHRIAGAGADALVPVSNEGLSPDALEKELLRILGDGPAVIFTDLRAGSCAMSAAAAARREATAVICGANLPMLLDFVFNRDLPLEELIDRVLDRGRAGIGRLPGPGGS